MNDKVIENALRLRSASYPDCKEIIIDLDNTNHEQHGQKMEGLGWDYKGVLGLSGVQAFDRFGYQYWSDVRADSTYCNTEVFKSCRSVGAKFVIAIKANMYNPLFGNIDKWEQVSQGIIQFYDGSSVEIGKTLYHASAGHEVL